MFAYHLLFFSFFIFSIIFNVVFSETTASLNAVACNSTTFTSIPFSNIPNSYPISIRWNIIDNIGLCLQAQIQSSSTASSAVKWFAVGFAASARMVNSPHTNSYLLRRTSSSAGVFRSYLMESYDRIIQQQEEDTMYEIVNYQISSTGTMSFTLYRPLKSTQPTELTLQNQMQTIIWAYGRSWPISGHGDGDKGTAMLNLYSSSNGGTLQSESHTTEWYNLLIIYVFILLVCFLLSVMHLQPIRDSSFGQFLLQRHLSKPILPSVFHMVTLDFIRSFVILKYGELIIILLYVGLHIVVAFASIKNLKSTVTDLDQQLGLVFGYFAALNLCLLLLPVVRLKILWETLCHTSYDRVIKFHRWIARIFLICGIIHGILQADRCNTTIFDPEECGNAKVRKLFGSLTILCTIISAILAFEPIRRRAYEMFINPHRMIAGCILILAVLHAPFFIGILLCIPVFLFLLSSGIKFKSLFFDKCTVQRVCQEGDGTFIELESSHRIKNLAKEMTASSYFLLRIPSIAPFEWHPITGIVSPNVETIGFVIKPLEGKNAWSRNLYEYVAKSQLNPKEIELYLSGPYGIPSINLMAYNSLVLVAGGIGITPMVHCLNYLRNKNAQKLGSLKHVTLVWIVQHPDHLLCCHDYLFNEPSGEKLDAVLPLQEEGKIQAHANGKTHHDAYQNLKTPGIHGNAKSMSISIDIKLYVTRASNDGNLPLPNGLAVSYRKGRPNLEAYITPNASRTGDKVGVMVCGPPALADDVQKYAMKSGFDCHREEFEF